MKTSLIAASLIASIIPCESAVVYTTYGISTSNDVWAVLFSPKPRKLGEYPACIFHVLPSIYLEVGQTQNQFTGSILVNPITGGVRKLVEGDVIDFRNGTWKSAATFGTEWVYGTDGIVGMEFTDLGTGAINHSWTRIMWNSPGCFDFMDAGYESNPFISIKAGAIPEPSSILLCSIAAILTLKRFNRD